MMLIYEGVDKRAATVDLRFLDQGIDRTVKYSLAQISALREVLNIAIEALTGEKAPPFSEAQEVAVREMIRREVHEMKAAGGLG